MHIQTYSTNNIILNKDILSVFINNFWNDIFSKHKDGNYLMVMVKVSFTESTEGIKSLAHLRSVNFKDKEVFINYISDRLGILNESYQVIPVNQIIFNYVIRPGKASDSLKVRGLVQEVIDSTLNFHRFNNMNLPLSMDPSDYGTIESESQIQLNGENVQRFIVSNQSKIYRIDKFVGNMINKVTMLGAIDLSWTDKLLHDGIVQREIGKAFIYFVDGQIILRQKVLNSKPFSILQPEKVKKTKFVTMDVETIKQQDGNLTPYLISAYNGTDYINSYAKLVNGIIDQQELVTSFITQLSTFFTKKGKTLTVYAHNLSSFDGIFLIRNMLTLGSVQPLIYNGKLISIKLRLPNGKTILFKDSMLLMPNSIRQLCTAFNVEIPKGHFPFLLNDIFYKGLFPAYTYWTGITLEQHLELSKEFSLLNIKWSFKDEAIKYCNLDCKCLYEILIELNNYTFTKWNINIHTCLTAASVSMKIFKSQFMPKLPDGVKIYQISGQVEKEIRMAYTGGAVDVYIPHNRVGSFFSKIFKPLYYYDVNSLYPSVMANVPMPIGLVKTFEGDIRKVNPNASGVFYCNITSPMDIKHPILQQRIKTNDGIRTIAGVGTWTGWINSNEMDNAIRHKYQIEIIRGHEFDTAIIFREFVEELYAIRMQYEKGHPMNYIAKLLMNSLYGKFGMSSESTTVEIFNISTEAKLIQFHQLLDKISSSVQDFTMFDDPQGHKHVIVVRDNLSKYSHTDSVDNYHGSDVNVAIAAFITAGGRIWMSLVKNSTNFNLYYSDTDSAIVDKPLPSVMIGDKLGQFKLEHTIQRAVFLAPKVYGFITTSGDTVIKVKGIKQDALSALKIQDLENLLMKDSTKEFNHDKWFKSIAEGSIKAEDVAYTLKVTSNKREGIYIDNVFEATKPFNYNEIKLNK